MFSPFTFKYLGRLVLGSVLRSFFFHHLRSNPWIASCSRSREGEKEREGEDRGRGGKQREGEGREVSLFIHPTTSRSPAHAASTGNGNLMAARSISQYSVLPIGSRKSPPKAASGQHDPQKCLIVEIGPVRGNSTKSCHHPLSTPSPSPSPTQKGDLKNANCTRVGPSGATQWKVVTIHSPPPPRPHLPPRRGTSKMQICRE